MANATTHIIRRQYLHAELCGSESVGLNLQSRLAELCRHWLPPAIDEVLQRCAPGNGHILIDRLEIDLGSLPLESLDGEFVERVAREIEKALQERSRSSQDSPAPSSEAPRHKTAHNALLEAFVYFLKTGSLPWWFHLPTGTTLEQSVLAAWTEIAESGRPLRTTEVEILALLGSGATRKRLIRQFSPAFLQHVLARLAPKGKAVMEEVLHGVQSISCPPSMLRDFTLHLWEAALALVAAGRPFTATDLVRAARAAWPVRAAESATFADLLETIWPGMIDKGNESATEVTRDGARASGLTGPESKETESTASSGPDSVLEKPFSVSTEHSDIGEGLYINHAGLVLLHHFLPQFFAALGIAAEDKLLQPERALCLLHFLTTGQLIAPEYELILPKILCNVTLQTPVDSDVALTATEQEEADALLNAVIRHWEALRNTSPDGLRGTFLLRSGKVSLTDEGDWLLQVESKTCDILLDQLPWGISMIKLPWMEKMLRVEWR